MSNSEVLAARDDVIAALSRLRAAEAVADGQVLIDGLKFDQLIGRQLRYDTVRKVARLDRDGEFTARGVRPTAAVADLLRIHPRHARRLVALAAAVFPTTLDGQPVEPRLPATAAASVSGEIDTEHAEVIEHALSTDAAGRIDPPRWAAAEAQLAQWARLCRPDELAPMAAELIEQLDADGAEPRDERQVNELYLTKSRAGVGGRVKGRLDSVTFETLSPTTPNTKRWAGARPTPWARSAKTCWTTAGCRSRAGNAPPATHPRLPPTTDPVHRRHPGRGWTDRAGRATPVVVRRRHRARRHGR